jgi:hypothetical protein
MNECSVHTRQLPGLFYHVKTWQKGALSDPESKLSPGPKSSWVLDFTAFRTERHELLL